jgi:hypothetical protein
VDQWCRRRGCWTPKTRPLLFAKKRQITIVRKDLYDPYITRLYPISLSNGVSISLQVRLQITTVPYVR